MNELEKLKTYLDFAVPKKIIMFGKNKINFWITLKDNMLLNDKKLVILY